MRFWKANRNIGTASNLEELFWWSITRPRTCCSDSWWIQWDSGSLGRNQGCWRTDPSPWRNVWVDRKAKTQWPVAISLMLTWKVQDCGHQFLFSSLGQAVGILSTKCFQRWSRTSAKKDCGRCGNNFYTFDLTCSGVYSAKPGSLGSAPFLFVQLLNIRYYHFKCQPTRQKNTNWKCHLW